MQFSWTEIVEVFFSSQPFARKYRYYSDTLHRVCIEMTKGLATQYNDFYSRLQAVCRLTNYPLRPVDGFRYTANQVLMHGLEVDKAQYLIDTRAFVDALAHFTDTRVPQQLMRELPDYQHRPASLQQVAYHQRRKRVRFMFERIEDGYLLCTCPDIPSDGFIKVDYTVNHHTQRSAQLITQGMQFNALLYNIDNEGVYHPQYIVIEPDFLVNITEITGCLKPYGDSAFNHLLKKFEPSEPTSALLLGDFANQFLDDAFNQSHPEYLKSMQKVFSTKAIDICACDGIDKNFFDETSNQYKNILSVVNQIGENPALKDQRYNILIEPSFFCEALGMQGRMDCLIDIVSAEKKFLIELKSGKWDDFRKAPKEDHLMQMLLYKEILYFNTDTRQSDVLGHLLYSKYPHLYEQRTFLEIVLQALNIRNSIFCLEKGLAEGKAREWIPKLTPERLKTKECSPKLWVPYCLPSLQKSIEPLHSMDALTSEYFYSFLQFIEREQMEGKLSISRPDSNRSLSSLWNTDIDTKRENGDIFLDLSIVEMKEDDGVVDICLKPNVVTDDMCMPNFRIGDSVILYKRNSEKDTAITQQVVRCSIQSYEGEKVWLHFNYPQRNREVFDTESMWALEHDSIEATFRSQYQSIFSLVTAEKSRRQLLLCQREPEYDTEVQLLSDKDESYSTSSLADSVKDIVLKAKQAKDMFLLMGPPGTGKTSVTLRAMVEESMASGHNILLLSYTNRAVDEICQMLDTISSKPKYIRLGRELACAEEYREHLLENVLSGQSNRQLVNNIISSTSIFVSTVSSMNSHSQLLMLKHFQVAIFDESSQILEPQIIGLLTSPAIDKFVMIGDHKQLPAVVVQNEDRSVVESPLLKEIGLTNCRNSLFERLYERYAGNEHVVGMLDHQGRMHPDISNFASMLFYDDRLMPVGLEHQTEELNYNIYNNVSEIETLVATKRMAFIDIPRPGIDEQTPKANRNEARMIAQLVSTIDHLYSVNSMPFSPSRHIGIIVPFRRQIAMVRTELAKINDAYTDIVIDTVERYQGSQRDIIIYGTTISNSYELDILSNITSLPSGDVDRKLNVAVTRARKQLFVLGNATLLYQNEIYKSLIDYCNSSTL